MKYVCLGYRQASAWRSLSEDDRHALLAESAVYAELLRSHGHRVDGQSFDVAPDVVTLHFERGKVSVDANPMAGGNGQLHEVIVLEARDLNSAIQLVAQLPSMRPGGRVEIRPVE